MLTAKQVIISATAGNSCARSMHITSDFSEFGDFEQELLDAIEAAEIDGAEESPAGTNGAASTKD